MSGSGSQPELLHAAPPRAADGFRYDVFVSYRHTHPDLAIAKYVHEQLETYRPPRGVAASQPKLRVFLDSAEMASASDLPEEIRAALAASRFLLVVCSPRARESRWIQMEIEEFRALGRSTSILTLLVDGEPAEAFPQPLDPMRALAADVRAPTLAAQKARVRVEKLRVLAPLFGVRYDDLRDRDGQRAVRRLRGIAAGVSALLLVVSVLAAVSLWQRSIAVRERDAAERRLAQAQRVAWVVMEDIQAGVFASLSTAETSERLLARTRELLTYLAAEDPANVHTLSLRVSATLTEGWTAFFSEDLRTAQAKFEETIRLARPRAETDGGLASRAANAEMGLAQIALARGEQQRAAELAARVVAAQRDLAQRSLAEPAAAWQLAGSLKFAAMVEATRGEASSAERMLDEAVALMKHLRNGHPNPELADFELAGSVAQRAAIKILQGRHAEAIKLHEESIALCEVLLSRAHAGRNGLVCIAGNLRDMGLVHIEAEDFGRAKTAFDKAVLYFTPKYGLDVRNPYDAQIYDQSLLGLAQVANESADPAAALRLADQIVSKGRASLEKLPDAPYFQRLLAAALQHRAEALRQAGELQQARVAIDESLKLRRPLVDSTAMGAYEAALTLAVASRIAADLGERKASEQSKAEAIALLKKAAPTAQKSGLKGPSRLLNRLAAEKRQA